MMAGTQHVVVYGPGGFDPDHPGSNIRDEYDVDLAPPDPAEQRRREAQARLRAIATAPTAPTGADVRLIARVLEKALDYLDLDPG